MNRLKILKTSITSTALLSIVILIATSFIMVVFPIAYFQCNKTSEVNDFFLCWCICAIFLFIIVVTANYYFAADKLIKRSGVMYIYGGKRSTIISMEIVKMLILFLLAMVIATTTIGIVIAETSYTHLESNGLLVSDLVDWKTHFICVGIMFAIYVASISLGLIKIVRFKPLQAISNNNTE